MKKLTFLIYHKEYEQFLTDLRELGVVHIEEKQSGEMDDCLQTFLQKRAQYKAMQDEMAHFISAGSEPDDEVNVERSADSLLKDYADLQSREQELRQLMQAIEKDISQMEVWGSFDWHTIRQLEKAGWLVQFYSCQDKEYDEAWNTSYNVIPINQIGRNLYFLVITSEPAELSIEPVKMPALSLTELHTKKEKTQAEIDRIEEALRKFSLKNYNTLVYWGEKLQDDIDLQKVRLDSEQMVDGAVVLLEGWIPAEKENDVKQMLESKSVYYEIRNARKEDNAPIKLKNNAFTRMYEVLTKMYGMPDYAEFDPTPIVAPFFTLFFAFCMGDAGYGLVLIALGFVLKKKLGASMRGMMNLVITLGVATTLMGTVFGTFFGFQLFDWNLPEFIKQFMIVGKIGNTSYDKQMLLALIIGVVHISVAMTVKAVTATVRYGFKESLSEWSWLLLVVGFVSIGSLAFFEIIPADVSKWAFIGIGGVAAIGIYLLNNIHRNVFVNIGAGLWGTYNMATGLLGDVLSYIRLYALGLASAMLGGVFNQLAMMVNDAAPSVIGWVLCALIFLLGHTLNIAMSCLSAFVHPLRLNFLEYFKNAGYEGKGETYKPFSLNEK